MTVRFVNGRAVNIVRTCKARTFIDHDEETPSIRCGLPAGHDGNHVSLADRCQWTNYYREDER